MSDPGRATGVFLSIEGPEGAGKTTQAERLRERLAASGREVVLTREPGGTELGERIRELLLEPGGAPHDPIADALLFNAARAQLVAEIVEPALRRGAVVLSTRFADSTLAYQGYAAGLPLESLRQIAHLATRGIRPDLVVVLDLPAAVGLRRKVGDELTRFETEFDAAFHERVRAGFLALAAAEPERFAVVDASGGPEAVADRVAVAVAQRVPGLLDPIPSAAPTEPSSTL